MPGIEKEKPQFVICTNDSGFGHKESGTIQIRERLPESAVIFMPRIQRGGDGSSLPREMLMSMQIPFVTIEARRAGTVLRTIREQQKDSRGAKHGEIAQAMKSYSFDVTGRDIEAFERGEYSQLGMDLRRVYLGASQVFDEEDPTMKKLDRIAAGQEWLRTLSQAEMTLDRSILFLRLSQGLDVKSYTKQSRTQSSVVSKHQRGQKGMRMISVNRYIDTSPIHKESKAAQLIRLKSENMEAMSLDKLQECDLGILMRYLRVIKGVTRKELGKRLNNRTERAIGSYEEGKHLPPLGIVEQFVRWFDPSQSNAFVEIIRQKFENQRTKTPHKQIPDVFRKRILEGKYLVAEHIEQLRLNPPPSKDKTFYNHLAKMGLVSEMIKVLIAKYKDKQTITITDLAKQIEIHEVTLRNILKNKYIPKEDTIARLALFLGYEIHDPIMQLLLERAEEQRAKQRTAS